MDQQIILHHYPQSPVAEKVRMALGIKRATWASVQIPRLPPKPDLMPLTGGYRRTPVMQIGADIYCDSQCILAELERRIPSPSFFSDRFEALGWGLSRWTDTELFTNAIAIVLGAGADDLPPEFAKDRGRLYFGPDADFQKQKADLPHLVDQMRGQLAWPDRELGSRPFLMGAQPGLADVLIYFIVWFLHGRWDDGPQFVSEFDNLPGWFGRMTEIGHGQHVEMDPKEALKIARVHEAEATVSASSLVIRVRPDGDGGDEDVVGRLVHQDETRISLVIENTNVGSVCVHFPRVGYRLSRD